MNRQPAIISSAVPAVGAITVTTLIVTTTLAILVRAVVPPNRSRTMAKVIAVLAAPMP
jgi:hypothetical protein